MSPEHEAHALDGIRPRHAACVHCGYRFGGVPIREGQITCPECGKASRFEFKEAGWSRRRLRSLRLPRIIAWGIVLALIVLVVLSRAL